MIFINELKDLKIYRKQFYLPRDNKDKKHGKAVLLLTPNIQSSLDIMNHNLILKPYYNSYYIEKNISLFIANEMCEGASNFESKQTVIQESYLEEAQSKYIKNNLYFSGDRASINMLSKNIYRYIENYCSIFDVRIVSDINIVFTDNFETSDMNTHDTILLPSIDTVENEEEIIKESIINFLLKYKYSKLNDNIIDGVSIVYSDFYDCIRDEIIDNDQIRICDCIENLRDNDHNNEDILQLLTDGDLSYLENYISETKLNTADSHLKYMKNLFSNMKRRLTIKTRKGTDHKYKKIKKDIESARRDLNEGAISLNEALLEKDFVRVGDTLTFFDESTANNNKLRNILYRERLRNSKDVISIYDYVTSSCNFITNTHLNLRRYKSLNLFVDLYYYNELFFKNNTLKDYRGADLYFDLMSREINSIKLADAGYNSKTVIIPLKDWSLVEKFWIVKKDINPISLIYNMMTTNLSRLQKEFGDIDFVFLGEKSYFKLRFDKCDPKSATSFLLLLKKVMNNEPVEDDLEEKKDSTESIKASIKDDIEDGMNVTIVKRSLTGEKETTTADGNEELKKKIDDKIDQVASTSNSKEDALNALDNDDEFKAMILDLSTSSVTNNGPEMSKARIERNNNLQKEVLNKKVKGKTVSEIINDFKDTEDKLEPVNLNISSIDGSWNELTFPSQAHQYNPDSDIIKILMHLSKTTYPVNIVDIQVDDTSNSEDYIYTYTVKLEGYNGKRFAIKFDIPKIKDDQYFLLRGNKKTINAQSFLLPVTKTGPGTAQIVSNYSKIFIETYGTTSGKSFVNVDRLIKTIDKYKGDEIKAVRGDCSGISFLYDLPLDYIDLGTAYRTLETKEYKFYLNQEEIRQEYKDYIDLKKGLPIGIKKNVANKKDAIVYYDQKSSMTCSLQILMSILEYNEGLREIYNNTNPSTKYTYSRASILSCHIPLIVLCGYYIGIIETMNRANIKYEIVGKKDNKTSNYYNDIDFIKFKDGYIRYENTLESSLLMNGLKECDTENYYIKDINSKFMYMDFLDQFGGRIKADGLDNFYDLMIDPITEDILTHSALPENYIDLLLYANDLLADNRYIQHADISDGKRIRRNELIAGYAYNAISKSYGSYAIQCKHGREVPMTIKQSAIIDLFLQDPTAGDLSIINPLGEHEAYSTISAKGLSGMNTDRAYGLAERNYHDSMKGIYAMSTGFAANVGVNRQLTINASVDGVRGYINPLDSDKDMNTANTLCMTEALSPFITTRDDPFRTAMTFVQTSKHSLRTTKSDPLLVSNGSDQVLPHLISNIFCTKANFDGVVKEITDDYMIIAENKSDNPKSMYVDLSEKVEKNSSSGFYVVLKQSTDLKVGSRVKKGDIVAYDKSCFDNKSGADDNITYEIGTLAKCAILNTDEGFEDSAMISQGLARALGTEVVVLKSVDLSKDTNIYNVIKKGTPVEEGDTLMVMQNSYDEDDANQLLKNLADDEEVISSLGRIPIKSKITGVVQDIKIYRTVELDELSDSLKKLCKAYESNIEKTRKIMKANNIDQQEELDANYKLPMSGKLKNVEGVRIDFYLKYYDIMAVGDKMIYTNALKGVNKGLFPLGLEPYSEYRKDERVDSMLPVSSPNGRMVTSVFNVGAINKLMVELSRQTKDMAGIKYKINLTDLD